MEKEGQNKPKSSKKAGKMKITKQMISPMFSIVYNYTAEPAFSPLAIPQFDPSREVTPFNLNLNFKKNHSSSFTYLLSLKNKCLHVQKVNNSQYGEIVAESSSLFNVDSKPIVYDAEEVDFLSVGGDLFQKQFLSTRIFKTWDSQVVCEINRKYFLLGWQDFKRPGVRIPFNQMIKDGNHEP